MAEFVEVMRIAKRICDEYANGCLCNGCPINGNSGCIFFDSMDCDEDYYPKIDKIVFDWAKEHPEPVYPSWADGWKQLFPDAMTEICPLMCVTGEMHNKYLAGCGIGMDCDKCKQAPIPAEIAKKLGIKPKEA